jgi:hypothetical protein
MTAKEKMRERLRQKIDASKEKKQRDQQQEEKVQPQQQQQQQEDESVASVSLPSGDGGGDGDGDGGVGDGDENDDNRNDDNKPEYRQSGGGVGENKKNEGVGYYEDGAETESTRVPMIRGAPGHDAAGEETEQGDAPMAAKERMRERLRQRLQKQQEQKLQEQQSQDPEQGHDQTQEQARDEAASQWDDKNSNCNNELILDTDAFETIEDALRGGEYSGGRYTDNNSPGLVEGMTPKNPPPPVPLRGPSHRLSLTPELPRTSSIRDLSLGQDGVLLDKQHQGLTPLSHQSHSLSEIDRTPKTSTTTDIGNATKNEEVGEWRRTSQETARSTVKSIEGFLIKQGGGTSLLGKKSWKRRWFILKPEAVSTGAADTANQLVGGGAKAEKEAEARQKPKAKEKKTKKHNGKSNYGDGIGNSIRRIKVMIPAGALPGDYVEFTASNGEVYKALIPFNQKKGRDWFVVEVDLDELAPEPDADHSSSSTMTSADRQLHARQRRQSLTLNLSNKEESKVIEKAEVLSARPTMIKRVKVVVPDGVGPGETVEFTASNGLVYAASVPLKLHKGGWFVVEVDMTSDDSDVGEQKGVNDGENSASGIATNNKPRKRRQSLTLDLSKAEADATAKQVTSATARRYVDPESTVNDKTDRSLRHWVLYYFAKKADAVPAGITGNTNSYNSSLLEICTTAAKGRISITGAEVQRVFSSAAAEVGAPKAHIERCFTVRPRTQQEYLEESKNETGTEKATDVERSKSDKDANKPEGIDDPRTYIFCAEKADEFEQWLGVLREAAASKHSNGMEQPQ